MNNIKKAKWKGSLLLLAGLAFFWAACNKGFDSVKTPTDGIDSVANDGRPAKIIYLIVDGARGETVRDCYAPNITSLTDNALYCWNTLTDTLNTQGTSWADMFTGVTKEKHGVISNDFSGNHLDQYPSFFKYIKEVYPNYRIAAYTGSAALPQQLLLGADDKKVLNNDDAVANAVVDELKRDSIGLVMGHFRAVETAGQQGAFDISSAIYKQAILHFDEQVGTILNAMRARKNFSNERWLVVIASSKGGQFTIDPSMDDKTIFSNPKLNTFTIYYSPNFKLNYIDRPYGGTRFAGKTVRMFGRDANAIHAIIPNDKGDYNFGDTTSFTVELKVKANPGPDGNYYYTYPSIFGKRASFDGGVTGWVMFLENHYWMINFGQSGKGNIQAKGSDISDGTWHSIAATVYRRDGKRYVKTFTDGKFNSELEITGHGNISTTSPLTMGFLPGSVNQAADVNIADVHIWKTSMDDNTIKSNACAVGIPDDHPYINYLIGYWPCTDGSGSLLTDKSQLQHDFEISGPAYTWDAFSTLLCPPASAFLEVLVPNGRDISQQIFSWLRILPNDAWKLDGRVWIPSLITTK
jgi:hypothetical protein